MITDQSLTVGQLFRAFELVALILHEEAIPAGTLLDDRHHGLARHVATEDQNVGFVVLGGVDELAPADLGAVNVRREKKPYLHAVPLSIPVAETSIISTSPPPLSV